MSVLQFWADMEQVNTFYRTYTIFNDINLGKSVSFDVHKIKNYIIGKIAIKHHDGNLFVIFFFKVKKNNDLQIES